MKPRVPQARDIVAIGASAGGVEALTKLVRAVPRGYTGSVFVVLHIAPDGTSVLPAILERAGHLQAGSVKDGGPPRPGCIYVAPPNAHLVVDEAGNVAL